MRRAADGAAPEAAAVVALRRVVLRLAGDVAADGRTVVSPTAALAIGLRVEDRVAAAALPRFAEVRRPADDGGAEPAPVARLDGDACFAALALAEVAFGAPAFVADLDEAPFAGDAADGEALAAAEDTERAVVLRGATAALLRPLERDAGVRAGALAAVAVRLR
ncbi:MAG: hypothetical protein RLZZ124_652 [Cyanobacteriota bacterium]